MQTFIIATHNRKKLAELERILAPLGISEQTAEQAGFELSEVEETGATFEAVSYTHLDVYKRQVLCLPL